MEIGKDRYYRAASGETGQPPVRLRSVAAPSRQEGPTRHADLVVECPNSLVAEGLSRALERAGVDFGWRVPGEEIPHTAVLWAETPEEALEKVHSARQTSPEAMVVILGPSADPPIARAAFRAGARGFVHAGMRPEQVARAIQVAAGGELVAPRDLIWLLVADDEDIADLDSLSSRQREVLALVAEGLSNAQIGQRLYLSESTIKQHLRAAYKTLGAKNRMQAAQLFRGARSSLED